MARHSTLANSGTSERLARAGALVLVGLATALLAACTGEPTPGSGITVAHARGLRQAQTQLVTGFVVADGTRVQLCESLAESSPPQCGGASIEVRGLSLNSLTGLQELGRVRWSPQERLLYGEVRGGVLTITGTSKG